jgi:hypothetical protein
MFGIGSKLFRPLKVGQSFIEIEIEPCLLSFQKMIMAFAYFVSRPYSLNCL